MSWFSGSVSTVELDNKIVEATSESIPNGELELATALEITDLIRSKKIPAKQCMRALKKRMTLVHSNPNLSTSTLKLIDLCVKNSGFHFLVEIASREFVDYIVDVVFKTQYNTKTYEHENQAKYTVGKLVLLLIALWVHFFRGQLQLNYLEKRYNQLKNEGFEFPDLDEEGTAFTDSSRASNFVDSEVPPDWVDNDLCMICYTPFLMLNRKHHCRSCGGVFCQTHSSNNVPLVSLGIREPVRVCDNCFIKHKPKEGKISRTSTKAVDDDDDLKRAIELSLQESGVKASPVKNTPPVQPPTQEQPADDEDEEMKRAIELSLNEYKNDRRYDSQRNEQPRQEVAPAEPEDDFYKNLLPQDMSTGSIQQPHGQYQNATPAPAQSAPRPTPELLTQREEEQINLYITLMNSVKNDPKKRSNILYDNDLSELHGQIVRLKPKVNKSLRMAIERHEAFLELNNKISTILRLYDQFLELKLSIAYGAHNVSDKDQHNQYGHVPAALQQAMTGQPTGSDYANPVHTGYHNSQPVGYHNSINYAGFQNSTQHTGPQNPPQHSGLQNASQEGYHGAAPGNENGYSQYYNRAAASQPTGYGFQDQPTGYNSAIRPSAPDLSISNAIPHNPTGYPSHAEGDVKRQSTGYPNGLQTSFPVGAEADGQDYAGGLPRQSTGYSENRQSADYSNGGVRRQLTGYPSTQPDDYREGTVPRQATGYPEYPNVDYNVPSEPVLDDDEPLTVAHALFRYPAFPEEPSEYGLSNTNPAGTTVRRQSSTLADNAVEDASARFPVLENEAKASELPDMPLLPSLDSRKEKKYVADPEPLIEL